MTGRRTSALDWLPSAGGPSDDGGEEAHTETGHLIQTHYAYPSGYPNRHERPVGWGYSIWEAQDDMGDGHGPGYECVSEGEDRVFPNHDGAKAAAEEHYYRLNHSKHRPPESRIDYENLINPRDGLDDDFGHIFGRRGVERRDGDGHGRILGSLDMVDLIRLAGDGMSWEDTMAHIDRVLAEGEPEDRSDYSTDYYHDGHGEHGVDGDPYDPYDHRVNWDEVPPWPDQDWQQTPGYHIEQHHKVKDGRHVLVEEDEDRGGFTWSHFNGDPFGQSFPTALEPNAWGNLPTREQAFRAAEDALAHTSGEAHTWSDMRHHGHDPMDQGDPLTYEGDPEFANIHHPNYRQYMEQRGLTPRTSRLDMADLVRLAGDGMSWEDTMRRIDEQLAAGFHEAARTAAGAAPVQDPAAMAPQAPVAGGYQPGHRVGLPWRDQVVRGTVIGVDGPEAIIRWDDGQYSNEEPRNIQLL